MINLSRPAITLASVTLAAAFLGGCVQTTTAPAVVAPAVAAGPGNCATEVAAFRNQIDSDASTGNLDPRTYRRAQLDANSAGTACRNAREGEAIRLISQARIRYGY